MTYRVIAHLVCLSVVFALGAMGCGPKPEAKEDKKTECSLRLPPVEGQYPGLRGIYGANRRGGFGGRQGPGHGVPAGQRTGSKRARRSRKGQPLFLIDPKPYEAQLKQAEAQVVLYQAQVDLTTATYDQAAEVARRTRRPLRDLQLRTYKAQMDEAQAGLDAAKASLEIYRINKAYTTVTSPIDGVVGRRNQTPGNVIIQDQTLLTTVVSMDKMYVYFDMDAPTYAQFHQGKQEKPAKAPISLDAAVPPRPASNPRRSREKSISSTTSSTRPPTPSWSAAFSRTPRKRKAGPGSGRGCSCASR